MQADEPGSDDYPFSGPFFVLTHEPPDPPDPGVTFPSGDIGEVVATALDAAGGKNLEILGADVAGQCLRRGLVDEILVYVVPVLLGDGIRFSPLASPSTWNRSVARGRETSPSFGSTSASSNRRWLVAGGVFSELPDHTLSYTNWRTSHRSMGAPPTPAGV